MSPLAGRRPVSMEEEIAALVREVQRMARA